MAFETLGVQFQTKGLSQFKKDLSDVNKAVGGMSKESEESAKGFKNMALSIAAGLLTYKTFTKILETVVNQLRSCIKYAAENETAMSHLESTLKSTGRGAEITAKQIAKIAASLMETSAFDDEAIIDAYNAMAKFENIDTADLEKVVKVAMDITAALGGDLASNANEIARIMETGLIPRSWGFTAALKEQVKELVAAGKSGEALSIVIKELNKRYGGQAAAELNTYAGMVKKLDIEISELQEDIGKQVLPTVKQLEKELLKVVENISMTILATSMIDNAFKEHEVEVRRIQKTWEGYSQEMRRAGLVAEGLKEGTQGFNIRLEELRNSVDGGAKAMGFMTEEEYRLARAAEYGSIAMQGQTALIAEMAAAGEKFAISMSEATWKIDWKTMYQDALGAAMEYRNFTDKMAEANAKLIEDQTILASLKPWQTEEIKAATAAVEADRLAIQKLQEQHRIATLEMVANWMQQKLAADGVFDEEDMRKMLQYKLAMGLLSADEYAVAQTTLAIAAGLSRLPTEIWIRIRETYEPATPVYYGASSSSTIYQPPAATTQKPKTTHVIVPKPYASGGQLWNGWSVVGEKGFELVGPGGMVFSHSQSEEMMSMMGNLNHFATGNMGQGQEAKYIPGPQKFMSPVSNQTSNYNYSPTYGATPNDPLFDFAIMQARSMA